MRTKTIIKRILIVLSFVTIITMSNKVEAATVTSLDFSFKYGEKSILTVEEFNQISIGGKLSFDLFVTPEGEGQSIGTLAAYIMFDSSVLKVPARGDKIVSAIEKDSDAYDTNMFNIVTDLTQQDDGLYYFQVQTHNDWIEYLNDGKFTGVLLTGERKILTITLEKKADAEIGSNTEVQIIFPISSGFESVVNGDTETDSEYVYVDPATETNKVTSQPFIIGEIVSNEPDATLSSAIISGQNSYNQGGTVSDTSIAFETDVPYKTAKSGLTVSLSPTKEGATIEVKDGGGNNVTSTNGVFNTGSITSDTTYTITVTDTIDESNSKTKTYTLNILVADPATIDNSEYSINPPSGSGFNETWDKKTLNYTITVPFTQTSIDMTTTGDSRLTISNPSENISMPNTGNYIYTTTVTDETGAAKTYTVTITKKVASTVTTLSGISVTSSNTTNSATVDNDNLTASYNFLEGSDIDQSYTFTVTLNDSNAKAYIKLSTDASFPGTSNLTKTGLKIKKGETKEFNIKVVAQDGTTSSIYTFTVKRASSTKTDVSSITLTENQVSDGTTTQNNMKTFTNPSTSYEYSIVNANSTELVVGVVTKANEYANWELLDASDATVSGKKIDITTLSEGTHTFKIKIIAQSGAVREIELIIKKLSSAKEITSISFLNENSSQVLDTSKLSGYYNNFTYTFEFYYEKASSIEYTIISSEKSKLKNGSGISLTKISDNQGKNTYAFGNVITQASHTFTVIVEAENGTTQTYTITFIRKEAESEKRLGSISINGVSVSITDSEYNVTYSKLVLDPTTLPTGGKVTVLVTKKSEKSTVTYNNSSNNLIDFTRGIEKTITILVTAQDGSTNQYVIPVIFADTNNTITNITVANTDFVFNSATTSYIVNVPYNFSSSVNVAVSTTNTYSKVTIDNKVIRTDDVVVGSEKTIIVYATSESGDKGTEYSIKIKRAAPRTTNTLNTLVIKDKSGVDITSQLSPTFLSGTTSYTLRVNDDENLWPLNVTASVQNDNGSYISSKGNYTYTNSSYSLSSGGVGTVTIEVYSEGGDKNTYTINISRKNDNNNLNKVTIGSTDYTISNFVSNVLDLGTLPYTTSSLPVTFVLKDSKATISVAALNNSLSGNWSLTAGDENTLKFRITSQAGTPGTEYTIKVTRSAPNKLNNIADMKVLLYNPSGTIIETDLLDSVTDFTDIKTFNLRVNRTISKVQIKVYVLTSDRSTVDGFGSGVTDGEYQVFTYDLDLGLAGSTTTYDVKVKAEDPDYAVNAYKLNITRKNAVNTIESFKIEDSKGNVIFDGTLTDAMNQSLGTFAYSIDKFTITITKTDQYSKVYLGSTEYGSNQEEVVITYNLEVGTNKSFVIKSATDVASSESSDYDQDTFSFTYARNSAETDNKLTDLEVINGETDVLSSQDIFSTSKTAYEIRVDRSISSVVLYVYINDLMYSTITTDGFNKIETTNNISKYSYTINLTAGTKNTFDFNVKSESGVSQKYTVYIHAKDAISEFSNLDIDGQTDLITFNNGTLSYNIGSYANSVTSIKILIEKNNAYSKVYVDGTLVTAAAGQTSYLLTKELGIGKNKSITIKVETEMESVSGKSYLGYGYKEYVLTYTRNAAQTYAYLDNLKVMNGSVNLLDGVFERDNLTYNLRLDRTISQVTITPEIDSKYYATVTGAGAKGLTLGSLNKFAVVVTAEDGTTANTYTINITSKNDNSLVSGITVTGYTLSPSFDVATKVYDLGSVPYTVKDITINVTKADTYAIVKGEFGKQSLVDGVNDFTVYVESEYGTKGEEYTIKIERIAAYKDINLNSLTVKNGENILNFDSGAYQNGKYSYTITLNESSNITQVNVLAVLKNTDKQIIAGDTGLITLTKNSNGTINHQIRFTVSAEDSASQEYIINIVKGVTLSDDETLKVLTVKDVYGIDYLTFVNGTFTYTVDVLYAIDKLTLVATPNHEKAAIEYLSTMPEKLLVGTTVVSFKVKAENGEESDTYTITINRGAASTIGDLTEIKIKDQDGNYLLGLSDKNPQVEYNETTKTYTIILNETYTKILINVINKHKGQTVTGRINEDITLSHGDNVFEIVVTPEDTSQKKTTYKITVKVINSVNNVTDLSVDGFTFTFDPSVTEYNLGTVDSSVNSIKINATTSDSTYGTLSGVGTKTLAKGQENIFTVSAISEDGKSVITYTIKVTHELSGEVNINKATLKDSKGNNYLTFDEEKKSYVLTVGPTVDKLTLDVESLDSKATVIGNGVYNLETDVPKTITFKVAAEDGSEGETYEVVVTRRAAGFDNTLKELTLKDVDGNYIIGSADDSPLKAVFNSQTGTYDFSLNRSYSNLYLDYVTTDLNATVSGRKGEIALIAGQKNSYEIIVTSESGATKTYLISITVKETEIAITDLSVANYNIEFDPEVFQYDLGEVDATVSFLNIAATLSNEYGVLTGAGQISLLDGENNLIVKATSEDGKKSVSYVIKVNKKGGSNAPKETDSNIYDIRVYGSDNTEYPIGFDQDTLEYIVNLKPESSMAIIEVEAGKNATVVGSGRHDVAAGGEKVVIVQSTAQDGTVGKMYKVTIKRPIASDSNQLLDFYVLEGTKKHQLSVSKSFQEITVNPSTSQVTIVATNPAKSTITGAGVKVLETANNVYSIIVISESGKINSYTLTIKRQSSDATLSNLTVKNNETDEIIALSPLFSASIRNYSIDLTNMPNVKELFVDPVPTTNVRTVTGGGLYQLKSGVGETTEHVIISVTAEDGTNMTYKITITRNVNPEDDISISDLTLYGDGVLYLGLDTSAINVFKLSQTNYVINVPYSLKNVTLSAKSENSATLNGLGNYTLTNKETIITFKVVSKSGRVESSDYIIKVVKADPSEVNTLSNISINGEAISDFDANKTEYELKVIYEDNGSINVSALSNDTKALISGNIGEIDLTKGTNSIKIKVTAENGEEKVYTVLVNALSNKNEILDITVDGHELTPVFSNDVTTYTLSVKYDVDKIAVNVLASQGAVIFGGGIKNLDEGINDFYIYAKSEYGIQGQVYKLSVNREEINKDSTLSSLVVKDGNNTQTVIPFTKNFEKNVTDYIINFPEGSPINTLFIEAVASSNYSFVTGSGYRILKALVDGDYNSIFEIDVRAQSGDITTYTISVYRGVQLSDVVQMKSFSLMGSDGNNYLGTSANAKSTFSVGVLEYEITIPYKVNSLTANMVAEQGTVYGNETLVFGNKDIIEFTLKIVSLSGVNELGTYTIRITREKAVNNNTLKNIIVNGEGLEGFNPEVLDYQINVPYSTTNNVIISAEANDSKATVTGNLGTNKLVNGQNVYRINVQSEDGTIKTYTIIANYLNDNAYLNSISVINSATETNYPMTFDPKVKEYSIVVPKGTEEVTISGIAQDQDNAAIIGLGKYKIDPNNVTKVVVVVVAADNKTKETYTVNLSTDTKLSSNVKLSNIQVTGYSLGFNQDSNQYYLSVGKNTDGLEVLATPFDSNSKVEILNANNLKEGQNVVQVKVTAEDGSVGYYHLLVTKDAEPDMLLTVLLIISSVSWIATILILLAKKSRNKKDDRDEVIF
ncbi:MAG: cadherin-like beta sandwich domain-containing protein [Acholeplasma sp.]|nr:cadherin-like beta sandwich domain-containing protein [Acholeplasma sp.]